MKRGCVEYQGRRCTLKELATEIGVPYKTIKTRWDKGWRGEKLCRKGRPYVRHEPGEMAIVSIVERRAAAGAERRARERAKRERLRAEIAGMVLA